MTAGQRIKYLREQQKMTQIELARKVGYKTKGSVSNVENRGDDIAKNTLIKFAKALGVTPNYLIGWEDSIDYKKINTDNLVNVIADDKGNELIKYYSLADAQNKLKIVEYAKSLVENKKD